jgi:hypothetical protein
MVVLGRGVGMVPPPHEFTAIAMRLFTDFLSEPAGRRQGHWPVLYV